METAGILTLRLAEAFGVYLLAVGAGALIAPGRWRAIGAELDRSPGLALVTGLFTFAFGAAIFGVHHGLTDPLAVIVTIAGAVGAVEGLLLIAVPDLMIAIGRPFFAYPRAWALVLLVLGAALLLAGLTGHANPITYS
jgi:hypothetical protein